MAEQLIFELPAEPALGRGDFLVAPGNAVAVDVIQTWAGWPSGKLVLVGPHGSGKTHLAHVWATLTDARIVAAADLPDRDIAALATGPLAIEDADGVAGNAAAEDGLFHLHNLTLAAGHPLLLTATRPPARWRLGLPDLASRMQGTAIATLSAPDETLLAAVLVKLFADRQLDVEPRVVAYLTRRMERSFAAAGELVAALDRAALAQSRAITLPLATRVLDNLQAGQA